MGRAAAPFLGMGVLLGVTGCAGLTSVSGSRYGPRWQNVCAALCAPDSDPGAARCAGALARLSENQSDRLIHLARRSFAAVVCIEVRNTQDRLQRDSDAAAKAAGARSGGTGVVIDSDGLILTNAHVVGAADEIVVVLSSGARCAATAVFADATLDLAVVRVAATGLETLALDAAAAALELRPGQSVAAVGNDPGSAVHRARPGVVLSTQANLQRVLDPCKQRDYTRLIESTAPIEPGFSGGPLLDDSGRLIGLNVAMRGADGALAARAYALPLDAWAHARIMDLVARHKSVRADPERPSAQETGAANPVSEISYFCR